MKEGVKKKKQLNTLLQVWYGSMYVP